MEKERINLQAIITQNPPPSSEMILPLFSPKDYWCSEVLDVLNLFFVGIKGENTGAYINHVLSDT